MSLFNNVFGFSNEAELMLKIISLNPDNVPRFRDCFYDTKEHVIVLHTRTGGGNREEYQAEHQELEAHPLYIRDSDDDYDCTYANFYFTVPEEFAGELKILFKDNPTITPAEKWQILFNEMEPKE